MSALEELAFVAGVGGVIFFGFGILGVISDFIFPRWKWLNNWIDTLPMMQEEKKGKEISY